MDLKRMREAGLYDPAAPDADDRRELLAFLHEQGCTLEEMQVAHQRGRLFALAGDRRIRPLVGLVTLREAAARLEVDPALLARAWRTFGLPDPGLDVAALTDADVEALSTFLAVGRLAGPDTAHAFARVIGSALARISEAEGSAMRMGIDAISVDRSGSEVVTARSFAELTELVPRVGRLLDTLHRQHLEAARVHFEDIDRDRTDSAALRCGVGFADLSGFTHLAEQLPLVHLAQVLKVFEDDATETVGEHGGRIVKFLGDAVMWVSARPDDLVAIARDLVHHPRAAQAGIGVRAGLAYGSVLAQFGDYFGSPVNLASRLVAMAAPGEVLLAGDLVAELPSAAVERLDPLPVRGFSEVVTPYHLLLADG
jgi:class 3 adenylate cyclase